MPFRGVLSLRTAKVAHYCADPPASFGLWEIQKKSDCLCVPSNSKGRISSTPCQRPKMLAFRNARKRWHFDASRAVLTYPLMSSASSRSVNSTLVITRSITTLRSLSISARYRKSPRITYHRRRIAAPKYPLAPALHRLNLDYGLSELPDLHHLVAQINRNHTNRDRKIQMA